MERKTRKIYHDCDQLLHFLRVSYIVSQSPSINNELVYPQLKQSPELHSGRNKWSRYFCAFVALSTQMKCLRRTLFPTKLLTRPFHSSSELRCVNVDKGWRGICPGWFTRQCITHAYRWALSSRQWLELFQRWFESVSHFSYSSFDLRLHCLLPLAEKPHWLRSTRQ